MLQLNKFLRGGGIILNTLAGAVIDLRASLYDKFWFLIWNTLLFIIHLIDIALAFMPKVIALFNSVELSFFF
jgi:hypothetical protein